MSPVGPRKPRIPCGGSPDQDGSRCGTSEACLPLHPPLSSCTNTRTPKFSYTKQLLEEREKYADLNDQEFNQQPGSVFAAGVDTTSATLQSFVLALILHPHVQKKAQEEMDLVVGQMRSPTWEDEPRLPYLRVGGFHLSNVSQVTSFL